MEVRVREPWADIARGFAIVTVIFFHVVLALDAIGDVHGKVFVLIHVFAPIPMALFFFVSGLFSKKLVRGGLSSPLGFRVLDLFYVFVVWSLIEAFIRTAISGSVGHFDPVGYLINPISNLWFIWALVLFTLVSAMCSGRSAAVLMVAAAFISLCSFTNVLVLDNLVHNHVAKYAVFFFVGVFAVDLAGVSKLKSIPVFGVLALIYVMVTIGLAGKFSEGLNGFVFALLTWIAVPTAISGCYVLGKINAVRVVIGWFGKNSLGLYVGHPIAIMLLMVGYQQLVPIDGEPALVSAFVLTLMAIAFSVGLLMIASFCGFKALYQAPRSIIDRIAMLIVRPRSVPL
ncbi:acyltransferase family protein [Brevundimonas variabilis]|uniref:Putative membrane protein YcfT n=1 Tax=Brevundimonas variabilis TaxID=74312 RepID=A0A7W9CKQ2_9CAUL|nr:acyltransferase family protein [Brevundimonas variabilis]MBB5747412.1 putative membrane protein YcfT [Brevundimonas variabilis]